MILRELSQLLCSMGIQPGDSICVFSDLTAIGIPREGRPVIKEKGVDALCDAYIETFLELTRPSGSLFFPAFTYSACREEAFDVAKSPSTVGALSEHFRIHYATARSENAIFSFAGAGPDAETMLHREESTCFGRGSFFDAFIERGGKYVLFGSNLKNSATFIYHALEKSKVSYRYHKTFSGKVLKAGREKLQKIDYFVRNLELAFDDNWDPIEAKAIQSDVIHKGQYASGSVLVMESSAIDSFVCQELKKNPECMVEWK